MSSEREVSNMTAVTEPVVTAVKQSMEPQTSLANESTPSTSTCSQSGRSEVDGAPTNCSQSLEQLIGHLEDPSMEVKERSKSDAMKLPDKRSSTTHEEKPNIDTRTNCDSQCGKASTDNSDVKSSDISIPSGSRCVLNENPKVKNDERVNNFKSIPSSSSPTLNPEDSVVLKAYSLANFIIDQIILDEPSKPKDNIEETLLRNVNHLMTKHSITFSAMMKRLNVKKDTGYTTFVHVANELFENEKKVITWSRIIALYAFGAQLALHCKEKGFVECALNVKTYMGKYVAETAGVFVKQQGGWEKLVEEFPSEDQLGDTMWNLFAWSAMGLGLATATLFFASKR